MLMFGFGGEQKQRSRLTANIKALDNVERFGIEQHNLPRGRVGNSDSVARRDHHRSNHAAVHGLGVCDTGRFVEHQARQRREPHQPSVGEHRKPDRAGLVQSKGHPRCRQVGEGEVTGLG